MTFQVARSSGKHAISTLIVVFALLALQLEHLVNALTSRLGFLEQLAIANAPDDMANVNTTF